MLRKIAAGTSVALAVGIVVVGVVMRWVPLGHAAMLLGGATAAGAAGLGLAGSAPAVRAAGRLGALLLLLPAVDLARYSRARPAYSIAVLIAGAVLTVVLRSLGQAAPATRGEPRGGRPTGRWGVALGVFLIALAASRFARTALSTPIAPDTATYWSTLSELFQRTPGSVPIRTPLYALVFALVQAVGGTGGDLIALQMFLRALACGTVAWMLGRSSLLAATVVGVLLACDPVSAATSVCYLTEGLYMTGMLLGLALVVGQLQRASDLRPWQRFAAGVALGWVLLFRPNGAALMLPVALSYAVASRSIARALAPVLGFASVAVGLALYNLFRVGTMTVAATGLYLAFPLFSQHLFAPENGPVSTTMHQRLTTCYPDLDYTAVKAMTSNEYIHGKFTPCLLDDTPDGRQALSDMYRAAYVEALRARPFTFAARMGLESMRFLATSVSYYPAEVSQFGELSDLGRLCRHEPPFDGYQSALIAFVCPMREAVSERRAFVREMSFVTRMLYQPYLYTYQPHPYLHGYYETPFPELTGAAGLVFILIVLAIVRAEYRLVVGGAGLVISFSALSTALGQVTILRYVAVTSQFLVIASGLFMAVVLEEAVALVRTIAVRAPANVPVQPYADATVVWRESSAEDAAVGRPTTPPS